MCQSHTHKHDCGNSCACPSVPNSVNLALWAAWNGKVEVQDCWETPDGESEGVGQAPEGAAAFFSVYTHMATGAKRWIADFDNRACADNLAEGLRKLHASIAEQLAEVNRLTECLENPVGYVNQGALAIVREQGTPALGVAISPTPNSHNNCAIYAQD